MEEAQIDCPYCWQRQTILLDLSEPAQEYIEDCQVCCQPITIRYASHAGELAELDARRGDA